MRKIDYPLMYGRVYASPKLARALSFAERAAVAAVSCVFLLLVAAFWYFGSVWEALRLVVVAAVPFATVSLLRVWLGGRRPYEIYDFASLGIPLPREGKGDSTPSRHAFSAFLIGTLALLALPAVGGAVLLLGVYIAAARVLLGYHFARDVIWGAVSGTLAGAIGIAAIVLI